VNRGRLGAEKFGRGMVGKGMGTQDRLRHRDANYSMRWQQIDSNAAWLVRVLRVTDPRSGGGAETGAPGTGETKIEDGRWLAHSS